MSEFQRVEPDTIVDTADAIGAAALAAVAEHADYDPTLIIGRPIPVVGDDDCGNLIAVRFSGATADRNGCVGNLIARFEVSIVLCIDDDPTVTDPDAVDADGRRIAGIMWQIWGGLFHNACTRGWTVEANPDDVTFGTFTISYDAGRALGRGEISVALPVEPVAAP